MKRYGCSGLYGMKSLHQSIGLARRTGADSDAGIEISDKNTLALQCIVKCCGLAVFNQTEYEISSRRKWSGAHGKAVRARQRLPLPSGKDSLYLRVILLPLFQKRR